MRATSGLMSGSALSGPLVSGHPSGANLTGVAVATDRNAGLKQPMPDDGSASSEGACERVFRLATNVAFDEIVGIERNAFHGFVYNLDTEIGFYSAGGVVTHNCDCMVVPG